MKSPSPSPINETNPYLSSPIRPFEERGTPDDAPTAFVANPTPATAFDFLAPPQQPDEIGRLGGYRVLRVLGEGGMGCVFLAEDVNLERQVALKVMRPDVASMRNARERFLREGKAAAKIKHDNIITIYQVGEDNGVLYLALEYLEGSALDVHLERWGEIPIEHVVRIGKETAAGLQAAHSRGFVHRDIKLANLWIEAPKGRVKILDFGLVRGSQDDVNLTKSGIIVGTPAYMSPEQARGLALDARSDLFSLGIVLYRLCTGRQPFHATTTMGILTALAVDEPVAPVELNPQIPDALQRVIQRLLAKNVAQRYQSAQEVIDDLEAIEGTLPTPSPLQFTSDSGSGPRSHQLTQPDTRGTERSSNSSVVRIFPTAEHATVPVAVKRGGKGAFILAAFVGLLFLSAAGVAYQLLFKTADGTLVVEVDGDADVRFKNGALQIYDDTGKLRYTLQPSDKNKALPPGKYLVKVTGTDGVKLETNEFTMDANGKVTLRVTAAAPVAVAKPPEPKSTAVIEPKTTIPEPKSTIPEPKTTVPEPKKELVVPALDTHRKVAEYVLTHGGMVGFDVAKQRKVARTNAQLPTEDFKLFEVQFTMKPKITDADVAVLKDCHSLTSLNLFGTSVTNAGLDILKDLKDLEVLSLGGTKVTDDGLMILTNFKKLNYLTLSQTQVSDQGLASLAGCTNLATLWLSDNPKLTGSGLAGLKGCTKLCDLNLSNTSVDDDALKHLVGWKGLKQVNLKKTKVTTEGVKQLADELPLCTIVWDAVPKK